MVGSVLVNPCWRKLELAYFAYIISFLFRRFRALQIELKLLNFGPQTGEALWTPVLLRPMETMNWRWNI